jgi:hypothetical protein
MLEANHDGDVFCPFCEVVSLVSGAEALAEVRAASCTAVCWLRFAYVTPLFIQKYRDFKVVLTEIRICLLRRAYVAPAFLCPTALRGGMPRFSWKEPTMKWIET